MKTTYPHSYKKIVSYVILALFMAVSISSCEKEEEVKPDSQSQTAGSSYSALDIEGTWKHTQGYHLLIANNKAIISSIEGSGIPSKLLGSTMYGDIWHVGENIWKGRRFQWRYSGGNTEDGRWIDEGIVELKLSEDKKLLTQDIRVFERVTN